MTEVVDADVTAAPAAHFAPGPPGPSRRWMAVFTATLAVLLLVAAGLTYVGIRTVRESRAGRSVSTVTDPELPGFEAFLEPTPTLLLLHSSGRSLVSAAVLALSSGDAGGSVLLVSPSTRLSSEADALPLNVASAYGGGPTVVHPRLQDALGVGLAEVAVIDDARWAELVAPVAPLSLENPAAVPGFAAGPISLSADQVGPYLAARAEGESDLARLTRQQLLFEAWVDAVAASDDAASVPGELDSGIGRFVRGLAAGPREVATLPVREVPWGAGTRIDVDPEAVASLLPTLVPFPTASHPGARTRVRLLDGTGDSQHVISAAPLIVPAGSEIVVVGNADRFDYQATEIRYHDPLQKAAAETLQAALGAGRVIDDARQTDAFDVTIVLGPDV